MNKVTEAALIYLRKLASDGRTSFTFTDLMITPDITVDVAHEIITDLEANGCIQVNKNVAATFTLI